MGVGENGEAARWVFWRGKARSVGRQQDPLDRSPIAEEKGEGPPGQKLCRPPQHRLRIAPRMSRYESTMSKRKL